MNERGWTEASEFQTVLQNYMKSLVNAFFKIIPIREELDQKRRSVEDSTELAEDTSLGVYMESLQAELLGCRGLVAVLRGDSRFLSLVAILQYLIDNPDCPFGVLRREVFKAIGICNALRVQYGEVKQ